MPAIGPLYADQINKTFNYDALSIRPALTKKLSDNVQIVSRQGIIEIDFSNLSDKDIKECAITICNLNGRVINVIKTTSLNDSRKVSLSTISSNLTRGIYIVKISGKGIQLTKTIVVK
jgi:hypothetical protein